MQSCVIMQRNPICLLDKYCHIYKRIFIFEGKSPYNVDLPSCIPYNSTPPKKKKLSEQTRCLQLFDWTEKCQNLVTAHGRVSIARVFLKSGDLTVFSSCDNACLSCLELIRNMGSYVSDCRMNTFLSCSHM